jgi:transposase-like protein
MSNSNLVTLQQPNEIADPLTGLVRKGARDLISKAVEAELAELLSQYSDLKVDGKQAVIRNGYLPEREIQTGIGPVEVRVPKVRDRSGDGIKFNSKLIPPYLKRTKSVEEFLPWLYLKGVSTGDFGEALTVLLGDNAKGLSANTISRLKKDWEAEHKTWNSRDLSLKHYVYLWADGVYFNVRGDNPRSCILVIIGATDKGKKELIAIDDGHRESEQSWTELLQDLRNRQLNVAPKLAVGDGALGFWKALSKVYPDTKHQRCWVHKTANVLNKLPKSVQPKVKEALHDIWLAETRDDAYKAFEDTLKRFEAKYLKAMNCLSKDKEKLLAFYDFPAEHWGHIRTTNPIESTFATVRLRTAKTRNCVARNTILAMVFKLVQTAEKRWQRLRGFELIADVIKGVNFIDGVKQQEKSDRSAA